ncbi:hypothetical protein AB0K35_12395 [Micromonospora sp. NPDC053740]|uniref:hypothetical protein n=1 Tax=Micromonospora sp. NPDC053740 TaxID=3155173 RepID=UPI00342ACBA8
MVDVTASEDGKSPEFEYLDRCDANAGRQVVYNIIHRAEIQGSASFGFDGPGRMEGYQLTGRVGSSELERLNHFYVYPAPFRAVAKKLREQHIVVLQGQPSSGRRAGAIQLLREVAPELPLVSLSPTYTFADLGTKKLEKRGYLLPDKLDERDVSGSQLDEIAQAVKDAEAFLVVTATIATTPHDMRDIVHPWPMPDSEVLLAEYLKRHGAGVAEDDRRVALAQLPADATPRQVITVGKRLVTGKSGTEALGVLSEENAARVAQWFDSQPTLANVQFISALAFLEQTSESDFELALRQLVDAMAPEAAAPEVMAADTVVPQQRSSRFAAGSLATVVSEADAYGTTGRRVEFKQFVSHERLVACLHERYDAQLWGPLTQWIRTLSKRRHLEVQASIARGVAQLWKIDRSVAEDSFLTPWSKGTAAEQLTAVLMLWWLGHDSGTEDAALKYATQWAATGTVAQRRASIVALSGSLGLRYPKDALKWMWRSATAARNQKELELARSSMVDFCAEAGNDPETLAVILRKVLSLVEGLPPHPFVQREGFRLVAEILAVRSGRLLLPTTCLLKVTDSASVLGQLWARVLVFRPARRRAVESLCACLRELEHTGPGGKRLINQSGIGTQHTTEELGRRLLAALPDGLERRLLYADVARCLQRLDRHDGDRIHSDRILHALQAAF